MFSDTKISNIDTPTKYLIAIAYGLDVEWSDAKFCRVQIPAYLRTKRGWEQITECIPSLSLLIRDFNVQFDYSGWIRTSDPMINSYEFC